MKLLLVCLLIVVSFICFVAGMKIRELRYELAAERSKPPVVQPAPTAPECSHNHVVTATVYDEQTEKGKKYVFPLPADEEIEWQTECGRFIFHAEVQN